jgi:hypothetical protein
VLGKGHYTFKQLLGTCCECNGNTFKLTTGWLTLWRP